MSYRSNIVLVLSLACPLVYALSHYLLTLSLVYLSLIISVILLMLSLSLST